MATILFQPQCVNEAFTHTQIFALGNDNVVSMQEITAGTRANRGLDLGQRQLHHERLFAKLKFTPDTC